MKHEFLATKQIGDTFSGYYLVEEISEKLTTGGKTYTSMVLRDKTASRPARMWAANPGVKRGQFIAAKVYVESYQNEPSFIVQDLVPALDSEVDMSNYINTVQDPEALARRLSWLIDYVSGHEGDDKSCSLILREIFTDDYVSRFSKCPGSNSSYYGIMGGSLERTVRTASNCIDIGERYGLDDASMVRLVTAALLSRCSAPLALRFDGVMPEYTEDGMLLGVGVLSIMKVRSAIDKVKASDGKSVSWKQTMRPVMHAIRASIGRDVKPMTVEAVVLSMASRMDFHISEAMDFISNVDKEVVGGCFTSADPVMGRKFYLGPDAGEADDLDMDPDF